MSMNINNMLFCPFVLFGDVHSPRRPLARCDYNRREHQKAADGVPEDGQQVRTTSTYVLVSKPVLVSKGIYTWYNVN